MNAADVTQGIVSREQFVAIIDALRAACGGGDIVMRADGTLWRKPGEQRWLPGTHRAIFIVPVDGGAQ